jgi:hypothetical protein
MAVALALLPILPDAGLGQSDGELKIAVPIAQQGGPGRTLAPDDLRNAQPMPLPELGEAEARRLFRGRLPPRDTTTPGTEPKSRGRVEDKPLAWAGKLFHDVGSVIYSCSAQFIERNVLVTAAHCVVDIDGNTGQLSFSLQYKDGSYRESYRVVSGSYWNKWLNRDVDRWRWDYALLCVGGRSKTGHFGFRTLWKDVYGEATAIGYPSALDNGEFVQSVAGALTLYEPSIYELDHGAGRFGDGGNGGAWVGDYSKTGGANDVISVSSFVLPHRRGRVYGPYFDKDFTNLLLSMKALGGC